MKHLDQTNIDKEFQKLFYIGRIINTIYIFFNLFLIYKILIELKISQLAKLLSVSTIYIFYFIL